MLLMNLKSIFSLSLSLIIILTVIFNTKCHPNHPMTNKQQVDKLFNQFMNIQNKKYNSIKELEFRKKNFETTIYRFIKKGDNISERIIFEEDTKRVFIIPDKSMSVGFANEDNQEQMKFQLNKFSDLSQQELDSIFSLDQSFFKENDDNVLGKQNFKNIPDLDVQVEIEGESEQDPLVEIQFGNTFFNPKITMKTPDHLNEFTPHLSTDPNHNSIWTGEELDHSNTSKVYNIKDLLLSNGRKLQRYNIRRRGRISIDGVQVKTSLNWKDSNILTPVKDQKRCNACYAFAGLAAIEANHRLHKGYFVNLSEQEIVDCSRKNKGCIGGLPSLVYEYVRYCLLYTSPSPRD